MIPKHKLAILIAGLKPKKGAEDGPEDGESEGEEDGGYEERLDTVVNKLADAIVSGKRDSVVQALHDFHDCITEEDEAQDEEAEGESGKY